MPSIGDDDDKYRPQEEDDGKLLNLVKQKSRKVSTALSSVSDLLASLEKSKGEPMSAEVKNYIGVVSEKSSEASSIKLFGALSKRDSKNSKKEEEAAITNPIQPSPLP